MFSPINTEKYSTLIWRVLLLIFIGLTLFRFSSLGRPIWIDEFLHFSFGAADTLSQAWSIFLTSLPINHGQTGVYMMLDYFLLHIFGANLLALRLPSLLCGAWLLISAAQFIRIQGFSYFWQIVMIFALFRHMGLMYFIGEARPYIPLAAAVVGTLVYYSVPYEKRNSLLIKGIGFFSVLLGVCMHPYFSLYWMAMFFFATVILIKRGQIRLKLRPLIQQANPILIIFGSTLYFLVAFNSWGKHIAKFSLNPFEHLSLVDIPFIFLRTHFEFLGAQNYLLGPLFIICILIAYILVPSKRNFTSRLMPPISLIALALILSLFVSFVSFRQGYWILPRQWVASSALVAIGFVWLCAEICQKIFQGVNVFWKIIGAGILVATMGVVMVINILNFQHDQKIYGVLIQCPSSNSQIEPPSYSVANRPVQAGDNDIWVKAANENIACSGPVWSWFTSYYYRSVETK